MSSWALLGFFVAGWAIPAPGDIIDRIAISVGNQVITESQIDEEIRLTAFLNHEKPNFSTAERKLAAGRLIEQALVRRDVDLSHYPLPTDKEVDALLQDTKARFASPAAYEQALQQDGISEDALKQRLAWQLTLLRFIDFRFRPGIQIPDNEIQQYYSQELVKWKQQGVQSAPTIQDARAKIEEILTEHRIDQALDAWMGEARKQVAINYLDEALK